MPVCAGICSRSSSMAISQSLCRPFDNVSECLTKDNFPNEQCPCKYGPVRWLSKQNGSQGLLLDLTQDFSRLRWSYFWGLKHTTFPSAALNKNLSLIVFFLACLCEFLSFFLPSFSPFFLPTYLPPFLLCFLPVSTLAMHRQKGRHERMQQHGARGSRHMEDCGSLGRQSKTALEQCEESFFRKLLEDALVWLLYWYFLFSCALKVERVKYL